LIASRRPSVDGETLNNCGSCRKSTQDSSTSAFTSSIQIAGTDEAGRDWRKIGAFLAILPKQITVLVIISSQVEMLAKEHAVHRLSAILAVCAAVATTTDLAQAGPCVDQLTTLQQVPQLSHQPVPESMKQAQTYSELMLSTDLARAETLDSPGNEEKCRLAARRAKHELEDWGGTTAFIPASTSRGGS
jgi:hypothetical protein